MVERPESAGQQRPPRGQRTIPSPQQRPPEPLFQVETILKRWNPRAPSSLPEQSCSSDLPTPRVGNHRTNRILSETARTRAKNADQNPAPRVNLPLPRDALFRGGPFFGAGLFLGRAFSGRAFSGRANFHVSRKPCPTTTNFHVSRKRKRTPSPPTPTSTHAPAPSPGGVRGVAVCLVPDALCRR